MQVFKAVFVDVAPYFGDELIKGVLGGVHVAQVGDGPVCIVRLHGRADGVIQHGPARLRFNWFVGQ